MNLYCRETVRDPLQFSSNKFFNQSKNKIHISGDTDASKVQTLPIFRNTADIQYTTLPPHRLTSPPYQLCTARLYAIYRRRCDNQHTAICLMSTNNTSTKTLITFDRSEETNQDGHMNAILCSEVDGVCYGNPTIGA